jgi:hypothetical protein
VYSKVLIVHCVYYGLIYILNAGISAINPRFASPMKLNGELCTPYDLYIPKCNEEMENDLLTLSHCCKELFDKDSWPEQTVTSPENYVILFFVSLVLLAFRIALWRYVYRPKRGHSLVTDSDYRFWLLSWWDQYVTVLIASVYAGLVTNYAKMLIGAARPCYYAFQIYSSVHAKEREAIESEFFLFPSLLPPFSIH